MFQRALQENSITWSHYGAEEKGKEKFANVGAQCKPATCGSSLPSPQMNSGVRKSCYSLSACQQVCLFVYYFCLPATFPPALPPSLQWQEILQHQLGCLMFGREAGLALQTDLHAKVRLKKKYSMYKLLWETLTVLSASFFWINFSIVCGQKGKNENSSRITELKPTAVGAAGLAAAPCRHMKFWPFAE